MLQTLHKRKAGGFTLIELLISLAVMSILAAIAIPSYRNYVLRSQMRTAAADIQALSAAIEQNFQRTLAYSATAVTTTAGLKAAYTSWSPAQSTTMNYKYEQIAASGGNPASYQLSAVGITGQSLAGCTITYTANTNATTYSSGCPSS